jgi:hypothetical protein
MKLFITSLSPPIANSYITKSWLQKPCKSQTPHQTLFYSCKSLSLFQFQKGISFLFKRGKEIAWQLLGDYLSSFTRMKNRLLAAKGFNSCYKIDHESLGNHKVISNTIREKGNFLANSRGFPFCLKKKENCLVITK